MTPFDLEVTSYYTEKRNDKQKSHVTSKMSRNMGVKVLLVELHIGIETQKRVRSRAID
jgi:hypothetical protein